MSDDIATTSRAISCSRARAISFGAAPAGHRCLDVREETGRYVEYQLLIGQDLYWYRRRLLRKSDGEVQEEIIGFNWFELNTTQLYTCRSIGPRTRGRRTCDPCEARRPGPGRSWTLRYAGRPETRNHAAQ